jgi:hypothetical protein
MYLTFKIHRQAEEEKRDYHYFSLKPKSIHLLNWPELDLYRE